MSGRVSFILLSPCYTCICMYVYVCIYIYLHDNLMSSVPTGQFKTELQHYALVEPRSNFSWANHYSAQSLQLTVEYLIWDITLPSQSSLIQHVPDSVSSTSYGLRY